KSSVIIVTIPEIGTERDRLLEGGFGVGGASGAVIGLGLANNCVRVARVQLQRALVFLQSQLVFSRVAVDVPQRHIDRGQAIVQLLRFLAIRQSFLDPLAVLVQLVFQTIRFAELGESQGKMRILFHGIVERNDGEIEVSCLVVTLGVAERLQI